MAKGVVRMATKDDPIFTERFTVSSKKADTKQSIDEGLSKDHESHRVAKSQSADRDCEDESQ